VSPDVSATIFDGQWHHVAAVLDRTRGGEVRLYLDGERIASERPAFCPPIMFDDERMGIAVGATTPWGMGKGGYRGLLDEIRISNIVRTPYVVGEPLSEEVRVRLEQRAKLPLDASTADEPMHLAPDSTILVLPERYVGQGNFDAARELQRWLRSGRGTDQGFDIINESELDSIQGKSVIALGRTQRAVDALVTGHSPGGFVIQRTGNVVIVAGRKSMGTYHGAMRLLDETCGVRFYMPTDLFISTPMPEAVVPAKFELRLDPFVRSGMMSGILGVPGDGRWAKRNAASRRMGGTHQHSMYAMFNPARYAESHPDIYPVLNGKRYIPTGSRDQRWQPCLSASSLVDVAEDSALRYFRKNPNADYVAFSVQDGHTVCQCDDCRGEYENNKSPEATQREYQAIGFSRLYWRFIKSLALRLQNTAPGKKIVALVYGPARVPPAGKMLPNVVLFTNFHIAELDADRILTPDPKTGLSRLDYVLQRCSFYGNHDWYHGNGFLMPRIYSGYWSRFMRHLAERVDGAYMHAEAYPNWGLDGPKLYIAARLWWEPEIDVDRLLRQFCQDMFGPAGDSMYQYFVTLEKLWITLDNVKGPERKLFQWNRQFTADADDLNVVRRCRDLLRQAEDVAETEQQKQRIQLFSKTFAVTENLYEFAAAETISEARLEAFWKRYQREILPDPMTLYGAGNESGELRRRIEAALRWATDNGRKLTDRE